MTASISGFQCRMTTLIPASRISPTLSGRSAGRRHGREGTRYEPVYAPPPAIAGRITSVSDSPTDVSSPSSTRTSSSLRYTLT